MKLWVAPAGLHVEPAMPADAGAIARLHAASFYKGWPQRDFRAYINDPKITPVYVACDARRRIAGFLIFRIGGDAADLLSVAVDRSRRGKGVGTALLAAGMEDLRLSPVTHIMLEVEDANASAIAMYRRLGFTELSRREGYYELANGKKAAALVMRGDLN